MESTPTSTPSASSTPTPTFLDEARAHRSNMLWAWTSVAGAILCFVLLFVIAAVWIHPRSRKHLDRVSFRLVTFALICNMLFGITSAVGGMARESSNVCGPSVFVLQLTMQMSTLLLYFIALNLQLVLVHSMTNPWVERLFFASSVVLPLLITVPPYASGQYGWDELERDCWYTDANKHTRLMWQISTQIVWTALVTFAELLSTVVVLLYMTKYHLRFRRKFQRNQTYNGSSGADNETYHPPPLAGTTGQGPLATDQTSTIVAPPAMSTQVIYAQRYKSVIFRIGLYPFVSCLINLLGVATVIHSTVSGGIYNQTDYNVLLLSDFLYGFRPIIYALLAATDPALIRGVRALHKSLRAKGPTGIPTKASPLNFIKRKKESNRTRDPVFVEVELSTISDGPTAVPPSLHLIDHKPPSPGRPHHQSRPSWPINTKRTSPRANCAEGEARIQETKAYSWDLESRGSDPGEGSSTGRESRSRSLRRSGSNWSMDTTDGSRGECDWFKKHL